MAPSDRQRQAERAAPDVHPRDQLRRALGLPDATFLVVSAVIGSGIFVRFDDVFEGYLPARRLEGDYYEPDALATALVGRRSGRRFRLGDPVEIRVEGIDGTSGKVNVALCEKIPTGRVAFGRRRS